MRILRSMVVPDKRSYKYTIPLPLPLRMLQKPDGGLTILLVLATTAAPAVNESKPARATNPDGGLTVLQY